MSRYSSMGICLPRKGARLDGPCSVTRQVGRKNGRIEECEMNALVNFVADVMREWYVWRIVLGVFDVVLIVIMKIGR